MPWRNSHTRYGWLAIGLHWGSALLVLGLFGLGLWMVDLTYYDAWYKRGPELHKALGVLLFVLTLLRLTWRVSNGVPDALDSHRSWERLIAHLIHLGIYALLFAIMFSGYLISTADGRALVVFDGFSIPATITGIEGQADIAGKLHLLLAVTLMVGVALHAGAALKHHFIDRDSTLLRMLGINRKE